ncbi:MAG: hypothetical protein ACKVOS_07235 [Sphingorhabdus sp.]|uniref:hypothetical protein n=1 Tax=Sphingorhabdus sp. TaxID=1902408 RepID=UPI0038FCE83C
MEQIFVWSGRICTGLRDRSYIEIHCPPLAAVFVYSIWSDHHRLWIKWLALERSHLDVSFPLAGLGNVVPRYSSIQLLLFSKTRYELAVGA